MNEGVVKLFIFLLSISLLLMVGAAVIASAKGIHLFWVLPLILLSVNIIGLLWGKYMLMHGEQIRGLLNQYAKFSPIAAMPNLEVYLPYCLVFALSLFGVFAASVMILVIRKY